MRRLISCLLSVSCRLEKAAAGLTSRCMMATLSADWTAELAWQATGCTLCQILKWRAVAQHNLTGLYACAGWWRRWTATMTPIQMTTQMTALWQQSSWAKVKRSATAAFLHQGRGGGQYFLQSSWPHCQAAGCRLLQGLAAPFSMLCWHFNFNFLDLVKMP